MKIVFLVGMPGVGKTYFGKGAAVKLGVSFIDLDNEIEERYQTTIASIFETKGESKFRTIELETIKQLLTECKKDTIIATGGGTPCFNNTMELLNQNGITVWLDTRIEDLYFNIIGDNSIRPLFGNTEKQELMNKLSEMEANRCQFYEQSEVKLTVYRGLSSDLFTKRLHLSTFAK